MAVEDLKSACLARWLCFSFVLFMTETRAAIRQRNKMSSVSNISLTLVQQPTQSHLPTATPLYDDAVYDASVGSPGANNTLFLWEAGCRSNQTWNCDQACSNSNESYEMVWNSNDDLSTLRNCLVYPLLATAASHGWLVEEPPGLLDRFGISPGDMVSVDSAASNDTLEEAWDVVNDCLYQMCNALYGSDSSQKCHDYNTTRTNYHIGPVDHLWNPKLVRSTPGFPRFNDDLLTTSMQVFWTDLCSMGIEKPNADLGGPGVRLFA